MPELIALREQQQKLVADARAILDQIDSDTPEARAKELEAQYDGYMGEYDALEGRAVRMERAEEAQARLDAPVEPAPGAPAARSKPGEGLEFGEVFKAYLRHGLEGLTPEARNLMRGARAQDAETRAQAVGTATAGGYLVPEGFVAELVKSLKAWGPMLDPGITREIATGSGNQLPWPTMDDTSNEGELLAENTQNTGDDDLVFGQKMLDAYKYTTKIIRVSEELLQDDAIDIEPVIRDAMSERIGRIVNKHLTTGTGTAQPNGIVTASSLGKTAAAAAAVTMDELIDLVHSVDPAYRADPSTRFMFGDAMLAVLRKIKDGNNNYLWQPPDARTGEPASLLGYRYAVNQAMDSLAASSKPVLFGAFNRYIVRRVREFAVRRLVERYADYFQIGFIGFARFDGDLLDAGAVKHLLTPAV